VPHLIWEGALVLLVGATITVVLLQTPVPAGFLLWQIGFLGLLASGLALSLRTATPNLAIAGMAAMSGTVYFVLVSQAAPDALVTGLALPPVAAAALALGLVMVLGAVLGLVAGLTSVPAWAVSLAGLAVTQAVVVGTLDPSGLVVADELPFPLNNRESWFVIFLLVTLAGGALFAIPSVRRFFQAGRAGAGQVRFTGRKLVGALVGFVGSSALAGLAGIAFVAEIRFLDPGSLSIYHLLLALAAVLVGGVSAFGGRGGIAGTALGVTLVATLIHWISSTSLDTGPRLAASWTVIALAILVGAGVSRALEAITPIAPDAAPQASAPGYPPLAMSAVPFAPETAPVERHPEPPSPPTEDRDA
jgi:ribose/xylose/arabinose/galactoside ABC-type transport system permease subunit